MTWQTYGEDLHPNLEDLHARLVNREYEPQPVVRQWIPKSNGKLRGLGLPMMPLISHLVTLQAFEEYEKH
ncbi:MAG: hypothetical protein R6T91_04860 [Bacteroidales bacterium]